MATLLLFSDSFIAKKPTQSPQAIELIESVRAEPGSTETAKEPRRRHVTNPTRRASLDREAKLRAFLPSTLDDVRPPSEDSSASVARSDSESTARQEIIEGFTNSWSYLHDAARPSKPPPFASTLWEFVDRELREDPLLSEYNRTGYVYLRFALEHDGRLRENSLAAQAEDPVLKVRSLKALRAGIKALTEEGLRPADGESWLGARFSWINRHECRRQSRLNGAFLSFCRHAVDARRDHSTVGRAKSLANITLNPLGPGPFGFMEAYDQYKKQNWRHDSGFDPFEKERRDPDFNL